MKMPQLRRETDEAQRYQDRNYGKVGACYQDEDLMRRLGLKTTGYKRADRHIGTVRLGLNRADVEVSAIPALGWRFTIHRWDTKQPLVVSTGTGPFTMYWPFIELLLSRDLETPESVFAAAALVLGDDMLVEETS